MLDTGNYLCYTGVRGGKSPQFWITIMLMKEIIVDGVASGLFFKEGEYTATREYGDDWVKGEVYSMDYGVVKKEGYKVFLNDGDIQLKNCFIENPVMEY